MRTMLIEGYRLTVPDDFDVDGWQESSLALLTNPDDAIQVIRTADAIRELLAATPMGAVVPSAMLPRLAAPVEPGNKRHPDVPVPPTGILRRLRTRYGRDGGR